MIWAKKNYHIFGKIVLFWATLIPTRQKKIVTGETFMIYMYSGRSCAIMWYRLRFDTYATRARDNLRWVKCIDI